MFRLLFLIINGIALFMITSCHGKPINSRSEINLEDNNCIDSLNPHDMFVYNIEPKETVVKEVKICGKNVTEGENENIKVYFSCHHSYTKDGLLNTEITNLTVDTIFCINNLFLRYKEINNSWKPLDYPDNYVKNDMGYSIPPQKSVNLKFYLPLQDIDYQGRYKLQLTFCTASKETYYYVDKIFIFAKSNKD